MGLLSADKPTTEIDLMDIFDEMLRLDAERTGIGRVLCLMGSRKVYAELFAKACETVLDKQNKL